MDYWRPSRFSTLKSEATKACSSPSLLLSVTSTAETQGLFCSNLKPPMHGRCRDGAKIQRKANRRIFGYLSGFAVLFPFPETRTIKASSCRQAGRGGRAKQKPSDSVTVPVCCSVITHSASAERQTDTVHARMLQVQRQGTGKQTGKRSFFR